MGKIRTLLAFAICVPGTFAGSATSFAQTSTIKAPARTLVVGDWRVQDLQHVRAGQTILMRGGRVTYFQDGSWESSVTAVYSGRKLPQGGGTFRIALSGQWSVEARLLREKITAASVNPAKNLPAQWQFARYLENQYRSSPSFSSDFLELSRNRMRIHNRLDDSVATLVR